jgi:outer membrane phospholipase A
MVITGSARRLGFPVWLSLALLSAGLGSTQSADIVAVFSGPTEPVPVVGAVSLWLNILNNSAVASSWTFPAEIPCRVSGSNATCEAFLRLASAGRSDRVVIAPASFARAEYHLSPPPSLSGRVVVDFPGFPAGSVALSLPAPPTPAQTGSPREKSVLSILREETLLEDAETPFDPGRFFKEHFFGYEPIYFIVGGESPAAKFQISFKYQLLNSDGYLAGKAPPLKGLHLAYTQVSLWDLNQPSAPFLDTSYKPEFFYSWDRVVGGQSTNWIRLDLQSGVQHESNGKAGFDSRSQNVVYFRPTLVLGKPDSLQFTLSPRAWVYVGDLGDNPDLPDYRGYMDLRAIVGWRRGLQLSALGRLGDDGGNGSLQLDLTYPLMTLLSRSFSIYLHAQYFTGYGESFLYYNERSSAFRFGFSLYR